MRSINQATKMLARNGWRPRHAVRLVFAIAAVFVATWQAWGEMAVSAMRHDLARPSVLVIPVVVWLVWVRRPRFRFVRPGNTGIGWVVLAAGSQFFYMGHYLYGLRSMWHLGAVLMLVGTVIACTGRSVVRQFLPAWLILPLLVPVPYTLGMMVGSPVQQFEAHAIAAIYELFGVSVEVFSKPGASRLVVGGTTLSLDAVCKGLPMILSLLLISYGFVFGSPMRPLVRGALLLITPAVALLCSALALGGTLWLYSGPWSLVTADLIRAMSEWVTLLIGFLLIAGAVRLLTWASVPVHRYHLASSSA